jgi:hypothetical protein
MFLIDDILLAPVKGLLYVFREIHNAVEQDSGSEAESIRAGMSELYMLLETGQITEAEADVREKELLDRLDAVEARGQAAADQDDEQADEAMPAQDEQTLAQDGATADK